MSTRAPAGPERPGRGFTAELRDAVTPRSMALVTGVLALQLGFILSYIGAFHSPTPHRIPVAVVAPAQVAGPLVTRLNGLDGDPVEARPAGSEQQARRAILDRDVDAAIVVDPRGSTDTLLVASAAGPALSSTAQLIAERLEGAEKRQVRVVDIRPPGAKDGRGLSSFYLVIGWIVGGYLAAAILGFAGGARPANPHRTVIRLGALALYAVVSGLGGALIAGPILGALPGHLLRLWAIGALVVFATSAATVAFQVLLGMVGIGLAILLFVVLGNPSAGGAYPTPLLPTFWRAIGEWLPTGAATRAVRNVVYFSGHDIARALGVLAAYAVVGTAVAFGASLALHRRERAPGGGPPGREPA
ncbi:DUF3533 domain-containing protein [Actinomadura sp. NEAU-AAG7]|uniref:DUF3533 domain-containing protein n=1 Tax=Actinomadura sp. NEAU-AAG7 TaxID=2839640 RepID=UPI001BE4BF41|nr:DUF3533 domain-containing protein [Actinomadura sp. NEAU-AAG7]MBT2213321.1 DUF3533 domain-containing protein [Actinomadura sp. NEAU-AAG7]